MEQGVFRYRHITARYVKEEGGLGYVTLNDRKIIGTSHEKEELTLGYFYDAIHSMFEMEENPKPKVGDLFFDNEQMYVLSFVGQETLKFIPAAEAKMTRYCFVSVGHLFHSIKVEKAFDTTVEGTIGIPNMNVRSYDDIILNLCGEKSYLTVPIWQLK